MLPNRMLSLPLLLLSQLFAFHSVTATYIQRGLEDPYAETPKCEPIRIPICQDLPYNITIFPNDMGHSNQEDAGSAIRTFEPLIRIDCSPSLKLFLCSLYFPVCTGMKKPLPPCRSLCEQNRQDCEPIMRGFNFEWPSIMDCSRFPENSLCISENKTEKQPVKEPTFVCPYHMRVPSGYDFSIRMNAGQIIPDCGIPCDEFLFSDPSSRRFSRLWIGLWSCFCVVSTLFTVLTFLIDMPRFQYPERPIIFLSACYLMVALTYVAGFILYDKVACAGPFTAKPPSSGLPAVVAPSGSPTTGGLGVGSSSPAAGGILSRPRLVTQGTKFEACIILAMLLYFFSMASAIWWVVLTITWYLAARCHWAHEAIARNAQYLHFAAWALPAAKTIGILALGKIDGDPLSGVCYTGLTDPVILRVFLIAPLSIYLIIGTGFLFAGFVSLFKIRTIIKTGGSKTDDLEKLIMRIGVFSLLYIIPAIVVIGCYLHESRMSERWMLSWYTTEVCRSVADHHSTGPHLAGDSSICPIQFRRLLEAAHTGGAGSNPARGGNPSGRGDSGTTGWDYTSGSAVGSSPSKESGKLSPSTLERPEFELFMIKYLMTLIVGITSGIWIWSGKTLVSWQRFFSRLCRRRSHRGRRSGCCATGADCDPAGGGVCLSSSIGREKEELMGVESGHPHHQHHHHHLPPGAVPLLPRGTGPTVYNQGQQPPPLQQQQAVFSHDHPGAAPASYLWSRSPPSGATAPSSLPADVQAPVQGPPQQQPPSGVAFAGAWLSGAQGNVTSGAQTGAGDLVANSGLI